MRVMITGAGGFIGRASTRELQRPGALRRADGGVIPVSEILPVDRVPTTYECADSMRVAIVTADLGTIGFAPDPAIQHIVGGRPKHFDSGAARAPGIRADADIAAAIAAHLADRAASATAERPR